MTSARLPDGLTPEDLAFDKQGGLLPAVVQDVTDGRVLMVGYVDRSALAVTLETGLATFHSRSRGATWVKGETSGNSLSVRAIEVDCDRDTLLLHCEPAGPTCHTGQRSCFGERNPTGASSFLAELDALVAARERDRPAGSYTTSLFQAGVRRIAQKVGEEGVEAALAGVGEDPADLTDEAADLVYHLLVLLRSRGLGLADVEQVLRERHR